MKNKSEKTWQDVIREVDPKLSVKDSLSFLHQNKLFNKKNGNPITYKDIYMLRYKRPKESKRTKKYEMITVPSVTTPTRTALILGTPKEIAEVLKEIA